MAFRWISDLTKYHIQDLTIFFLLYDYSWRQSDAADLMDDFFQHSIRSLAQIMDEGIRDGAFREVNCSEVAYFFLACFMGIASFEGMERRQLPQFYELLEEVILRYLKTAKD